MQPRRWMTAACVFIAASVANAQIVYDNSNPPPPLPDHTVTTSSNQKYSLNYTAKDRMYTLVSGDTVHWKLPARSFLSSPVTIVGEDGRLLTAGFVSFCVMGRDGKDEANPKAWKALGHKNEDRFIDKATEVLVPSWHQDIAMIQFAHGEKRCYSIPFRWGDRLVVDAADLSMRTPTAADKPLIDKAEEDWAAVTLAECVEKVDKLIAARTASPTSTKETSGKQNSDEGPISLTGKEAGSVIDRLTAACLILGDLRSKRGLAELRKAERWTGWTATGGLYVSVAPGDCAVGSFKAESMRLPVHYALLRAGESPSFAAYECPCWHDRPEVVPQPDAKDREREIRAITPGMRAEEIQKRCGGQGLNERGVWFYDIAGDKPVTVEITFENGKSSKVVTHEGGLWDRPGGCERYLY